MGGFVVGGGACGGFNVLSSKLDDEEKNDAVQGGELQVLEARAACFKLHNPLNCIHREHTVI